MQELREVLAARGLLMSGCWVTGESTGNCLGCVRMFSPNVVTFMNPVMYTHLVPSGAVLFCHEMLRSGGECHPSAGCPLRQQQVMHFSIVLTFMK